MNDRKYTLHLPDYVSKKNLVDPLSNDKDIRNESIKVIKNTIKIGNNISEFTKKNVKIVGSFSVINKNKKNTLDSIFNLLEYYFKDNIIILPQWLPKIAWYYGGAEKINIFCDEDDINYIIKYKKKICLDISHLILSANYHDINWVNWYNKLIKYSELMHLSDGVGIGGEGLEFGKDILSKMNIIFKSKNIKVLEVWQGHLNNGKKFHKAINQLYNEIS